MSRWHLVTAVGTRTLWRRVTRVVLPTVTSVPVHTTSAVHAWWRDRPVPVWLVKVLRQHVYWTKMMLWIIVDGGSWWSGWVLVGECFFCARLTWVVPLKVPLNGCWQVAARVHISAEVNRRTSVIDRRLRPRCYHLIRLREVAPLPCNGYSFLPCFATVRSACMYRVRCASATDSFIHTPWV